MAARKTFLSLAVASMVVMASATAISETTLHQPERRQGFDDSYNIYLRKRNAHACMMSIVFIVLYPLGAISLHLPLHGIIRRVVTRLHVPIQILGLCMMIGAMGLGIDIARNDMHYIDPVKTHVALGLFVTSTIIAVQPAMGIIQHIYFRKTGQKSIFAYAHRWTGRIAIILGWANSWLGFKLVGWELTPTHSLVRNGVLMGVFGAIWISLVGVDGIRHHFMKKEKLAAMDWRFWRRRESSIDQAKDASHRQMEETSQA